MADASDFVIWESACDVDDAVDNGGGGSGGVDGTSKRKKAAVLKRQRKLLLKMLCLEVREKCV
jgi:hypothetical protein